MRVLLIAPQPFYQERGTPIAVRLLAETLCQFGHTVDLLVYHAGEDISVPGLRLIRAARPPGVGHVPIGISWQKLLCDVALFAAMVKLLRRNDYDVIHAVEEAIFPTALFAAFSRRKFVYDMDSSLSEQLTDKWRMMKPFAGMLRWIERLAVSRATPVFAVCEDLASKVRPWVGPNRVLVLPDVPLDDDATQAGSVDRLRDLVCADAVVGLYVGNLERYQGIDLLVDAITLVPPSERFEMIVIGGDPASVERYREQARLCGVAERLHFVGARPVGQLNGYLAQADILVSPRILGGNTPMKIYSYMQSGKAILATQIRSHLQAIDATCAELVPAEPQAMADGIVRLTRDLERRRRLGLAARERAQREYSLPVFQKKLQLAYERMSHA